MAPKAGPSGSRPASTSTIAQAGPSTLPPPPPPQMAAFSKDNALYASARPAIGLAEKLAVWDVVNDRLRWEIDVSGSKAVSWASLPDSEAVAPEPSAKKQRRRKTASALTVVLLAGDQVTYYSAEDGRILHTVAVPTGSRAFVVNKRNIVLVGDGVLNIIDATGAQNTVALPSAVARSTAISLLATPYDVLHLVIGSLSIALVEYNFSTQRLSVSTPVPVSTASVSVITPIAESLIAVASPDDRSASIFQITHGQLKLVHRLSPPTVSPVHSLFPSQGSVTVVSQSGETFLFTLPSSYSTSKPTTDSMPAPAKVVIGKSEGNARVAAVASLKDGRRVAAVLIAGRVSWVDLEAGKAITRVDAATLGSLDVGESISTQRFSGAQSAPSHANDSTADVAAEAALPTDVHLADLSLGERLLALPTTEVDDAPATETEAVTANSLSRLLVQGLHTNDPAQIAMCLAQRDPTLIRNTIRGMPITMALPLLRACVERLGKGRGGQAQQQARGTVEWVKAVLVERGSTLLTIPSLAMHLSSLNALLEARLRLHAPLLALNGRLDLALAQIEMRRLALERAKAGPGSKGKAARYVEGESEDEMEVFGEDEGEVEDIGLGEGISSAEESDEDEDDDLEVDDDDEDDEDESDSDDDSGSEGNAFIDNEAEDSDGEVEEDSDDMEE